MAGGNGQPNPSAHLFLIAGIFVIMYFFMIRPQSKKANEQREFIQNIQKGDKVVTIGGLHGKVMKVDETSLLLEVDNNVKLRIEKTAISFEYTKALRAAAAVASGTEEKNS
ncbi:preprotein translocase subunit YajC [Sphingobacteriales bacterium UPWRP_1]|nr:preprotein translocase subunit YajC [Sphingobacteriales bacterium UPWRP_1]